MANLNGTEDFNKYLSEEVVQLGDKLGSDEVVDFKLKWAGAKEDIEYCFGSCHCTDAYYSDGHIQGTLNLSKSNYDRETGVVSQYVHVYLNDGHKFFITDDKLRRIHNPTKSWVRIRLTGKVDL